MRTILYYLPIFLIFGSVDAEAQYFKRNLRILPSYSAQIDQVDQWYWTDDYAGRAGWDLGLEVRYGHYWYVQSGLHYFRFNRELIAEPYDWSYVRLSPDQRTEGIFIPLEMGFDLLGWGDFGIRGFGGPSLHLYKDGSNSSGLSRSRLGMQAGVGFDLAVVALDFTYNFTLANSESSSLLKRSDLFSFGISALLDWPQNYRHRSDSN